MSYLFFSADRFWSSGQIFSFGWLLLFFLFFLFSCSADTSVIQKKLLLVVSRYKFLDVSQFVVQILTADLLLLVVRIRLEKTKTQI